MRIIRHRTLIILLLLATLAACRREQPAPAPPAPAPTVTAVTIATPVGPTSGPVYVAQARGIFKADHLNTTVVPFTSGRLALDALLAGKTQVALVAETPLALAAFQSPRIRIIGTMTRSPHKLVVRPQANVRVPRDLKGKTVSALQGSAGQYWMHAYLRKNGLSDTDVRYVNLQPADMVSALVGGNIDAFFAWEPYPYLAQKQAGGSLQVTPSTGIYTQLFNIAVTEEFARSNAPAVDALLRSILQAEEFMRTNRAEAVRIVAKDSSMDPATLDGIWNDHLFQTTLAQDLVDTMNAEAAWAQQSGMVSTGSLPDYRSYIAADFLKRVAGSRVEGF